MKLGSYNQRGSNLTHKDSISRLSNVIDQFRNEKKSIADAPTESLFKNLAADASEIQLQGLDVEFPLEDIRNA